MRGEMVSNAKGSVPKYTLVVKISKIVATNAAPAVLLWVNFDEELDLFRQADALILDSIHYLAMDIF
jgi:hypothetical protein